MSRTQMVNSRGAQESVRRTALIAMLRAVRCTVVSGTMPTPTLHSTRRQIASKLRVQLQRTADAVGLVGEKPLNRAGAIEPHHVVVEHLGKSDARAAGERMIARDDEHETVAAERKGLQAGMIDGAGNDTDIGAAFRHQVDDLVAQALLEVHADIWIGREERTQRLRQEFGERIGVGEYPHLAGEPARVRAKIILQAGGLRQDRARMLQQRAAGLRRGDTLAQTERLQEDLSPYARGLAGQVRVLSNTNALTEFLPETLSSFLMAYPDISVDLEERLSDEIVGLIADGSGDIGIVAGTVDYGGLHTFPFRSDRFVLVVARSHPLASRSRIGFAEVLDYDMVGLDRASAIQRFLADKANRVGRPLRLRVQLRSFDAICRLVECNVGVGIVPETTVKRTERNMAISSVRLTD